MPSEYEYKYKIPTPSLDLESNLANVAKRSNEMAEGDGVGEVVNDLNFDRTTPKATALDLNLPNVCKKLSEVNWSKIKSKADVCDLLRSKIKRFMSALYADGFQVQFNENAFNELEFSDFEGLMYYIYDDFLGFINECIAGARPLTGEMLNFKNGVIVISYNGSLSHLKNFVDQKADFINVFLKVYRNILKFGEEGFVNQSMNNGAKYSGPIIQSNIKRALSLREKDEYRDLFTVDSRDIIERELGSAIDDVKKKLFEKVFDTNSSKEDIGECINGIIYDLSRPYIYLRATALKLINPGKKLKFYHIYPVDITEDDDVNVHIFNGRDRLRSFAQYADKLHYWFFREYPKLVKNKALLERFFECDGLVLLSMLKDISEFGQVFRNEM